MAIKRNPNDILKSMTYNEAAYKIHFTVPGADISTEDLFNLGKTVKQFQVALYQNILKIQNRKIAKLIVDLESQANAGKRKIIGSMTEAERNRLLKAGIARIAKETPAIFPVVELKKGSIEAMIYASLGSGLTFLLQATFGKIFERAFARLNRSKALEDKVHQILIVLTADEEEQVIQTTLAELHRGPTRIHREGKKIEVSIAPDPKRNMNYDDDQTG